MNNDHNLMLTKTEILSVLKQLRAKSRLCDRLAKALEENKTFLPTAIQVEIEIDVLVAYRRARKKI